MVRKIDGIDGINASRMLASKDYSIGDGILAYRLCIPLTITWNPSASPQSKSDRCSPSHVIVRVVSIRAVRKWGVNLSRSGQ